MKRRRIGSDLTTFSCVDHGARETIELHTGTYLLPMSYKILLTATMALSGVKATQSRHLDEGHHYVVLR